MTELKTHTVPEEVDPNDWTLSVTGAVSDPFQVDRDELLEFPLESVVDDFECIEGWIANDLAWRGIRVGSILDRAKPILEADYVLVHAVDGDYACLFPRDRVDNALLALTLDGQPLPVEHGGPARLVPTSDESDCWESVKWVKVLEVREEKPETGDTAKQIATSRLE